MKHTAILLIVLSFFASCRTIRQTETEFVSVHDTDTLYLTKWKHDSIYIQEKINTYLKGDTVYVDRWRTEYRDRIRTDTLTKIVTRDLYHTQVVDKVQEVNRLKWWQTTLMCIGVAGIAFALWKLIKRLKPLVS